MSKSQTEAELLARCRQKGLRITGPRRIIADVMSKASDHPDTQELHRRVLKRDPRISLSTVYRTLRTFAELGIVEQHQFEGGRSRSELAMKEHHDHLIDTTTGKVIEFRSDAIERLQAQIANELGYELTGHRLELYGRPISKKRGRSR
jgi:Fur family ferric uptake transcriptional regulator